MTFSRAAAILCLAIALPTAGCGDSEFKEGFDEGFDRSWKESFVKSCVNTPPTHVLRMKRAKRNCSAVPVTTVRQGIILRFVDSDQAIARMTTMPSNAIMLPPAGTAPGRSPPGQRRAGLRSWVRKPRQRIRPPGG